MPSYTIKHVVGPCCHMLQSTAVCTDISISSATLAASASYYSTPSLGTAFRVILPIALRFDTSASLGLVAILVEWAP